MRRREFITLLGGAAVTWPMAARGQQMRRVGVLMNYSADDPEGQARVAAFQQSLEKLGWTIGSNLSIDCRWGVGVASARAAAAELLTIAPDLVLASAGESLTAMRQASSTVPIVFVGISEPVERGFVQSLAKPGSNTTGFTNLEATMGARWLQLLKEIAPPITRVVSMFNPQFSFAVQFLHSAEKAAQELAVEIIMAPVHSPAEIEAAFTMLGHETSMGLMFPPDGFTITHREQILELTARYRLPAIFQFRAFTVGGGLMSYGVEAINPFRQAATYVDRILRGEKAGDLPVQQPTKFELVINLKTAKALGLVVPLTLQVAADEVIE